MLMNLPNRPRSRNSTMPLTLANRVSSLPRPTFSPGFKGVPRCRTMIEPPGTFCPPKTFTPRRCAFESRPFLELPKPFLCAIYAYLCDDLIHLQLGKMLPVSDGALVLLLALELEDDHLFRAVVSSDRSDYFGVSQLRFGQHLAVLEYREDMWEFERRADVEWELFHPYRIAGRYPVLLPTSLNDCVHGASLRPGT